MQVRETFVNATENHLIGEFPPDESNVDGSSAGDIYRACIAEGYGRCVSKMYRDQKDGPARACGWVFQSRQKYEDCDETYLREVWVELVEPYERETTETAYRPHYIG